VHERPAPLRLVARRPLSMWVAAAGVMLLTSQIGMPTMSITGYDARDWLFGHLLYGLMAVCFALPAMVGDPARGGVPARVLSWRPIAWLGLISYGVFLWHMPFTEQFAKAQDWTSHGSFFVYTAVVAGTAICCAAASYYLVERPLLRFKDPRAPRASRAPAAQPATAAGSLAEGQRVQLASPAERPASAG
jgi:peptidoglycan/LPS O-acetylase OafA/YrhL